MTYQVSEQYSVTMERTCVQTTDKSTSVVRSIQILIRAEQRILIKISLSVLPVEYRETVYKL